MFIWDFVLKNIMEQIIEWIYGQVVGFLADFFAPHLLYPQLLNDEKATERQAELV